MSEEAKKLNIYQKLVEVRKKVLYVQKNAKGHNFKYASGSSIIAEIRKEMDNQNLLLIPNMEDFKAIVGSNKVSSQVTISYTWIDADDPEKQIKTNFTYIDDKIGGCQGIGAILTYSERYFLCKFFQIATDIDDPDAFKKKHNFVDLDEEEDAFSSPSNDFTLDELASKVCYEIGIQISDDIKSCISICIRNEKSLKSWFEKFTIPTQKQKFVEFYERWLEKNRSVKI